MSAAMSFHTGTTDPLWLSAWVPQSEQAYIGTLLGIFFLAVLSRSLDAAAYTYIAALLVQRHLVRVNPHVNAHVDETTPDLAPFALPVVPSFNWRDDTIRGTVVLVQQFLAYLLMLCVMTLNVGYFFAVLVGSFVGEVFFGRYRMLHGNKGAHMH
ncbi:Ctr copper transporter [Endogone sp. FLAS-F59071]|nr:Ctr copper transporter [Endogone sp. FLAS-F59071]|eukprot:RUS16110.1 Ctr copper transporter [Endogone sp. FLAS-F59071]